jgi:hypothetical protein
MAKSWLLPDASNPVESKSWDMNGNTSTPESRFHSPLAYRSQSQKYHKCLQQSVLRAQATPVFDKVVFSKIKARLGGRVKLIVSGGAPLAGHVEEFLKITMCAPVVQVPPSSTHPFPCLVWKCDEMPREMSGFDSVQH